MVDVVALERFAPLRLALLGNRLTRMMRRACHPLGLSGPGWRVIALLGQTGALPLSQVLARSRIDKARLSRITSQLCAQGYIELQTPADDRRRISLVLTPRGKEVHRELMRLLTDLQTMLLRNIGSDEYQAFGRVVDSLESQIKAAESAPVAVGTAAADSGA